MAIFSKFKIKGYFIKLRPIFIRLNEEISPYFKKCKNGIKLFSKKCNKHHVLAQGFITILVGGILAFYLDFRQHRFQKQLNDKQIELQNQLQEQQISFQEKLAKQQEESQRKLTTTQILEGYFDGIGDFFQNEKMSRNQEKIIIVRTQILLNNLYTPQERSEVIRFLSALKPELFDHKNKSDYISLSGYNLEGVDFTKIRLPGANFTGTNLKGAIFNFAILDSAIFKDANLHKADFENAYLRHTIFTNAIMDSINLDGAKLQKANLDGISLNGIHLTYTNLEEASLIKAKLHDMRMDGVNLKNAKLQRSVFSNNIISQSALIGANLNNAKIIESTFNRVNLQKSQFENTYIINSKFQACGLRKANFKKAGLFVVGFSDDNYSPLVVPDEDSPHSIYLNQSLNQVNFESAILGNVDFGSMNLDSSDFTNAKLYVDLKISKKGKEKIDTLRFYSNLTNVEFENIIWVDGDVINKSSLDSCYLNPEYSKKLSSIDLPYEIIGPASKLGYGETWNSDYSEKNIYPFLIVLTDLIPEISNKKFKIKLIYTGGADGVQFRNQKSEKLSKKHLLMHSIIWKPSEGPPPDTVIRIYQNKPTNNKQLSLKRAISLYGSINNFFSKSDLNSIYGWINEVRWVGIEYPEKGYEYKYAKVIVNISDTLPTDDE